MESDRNYRWRTDVCKEQQKLKKDHSFISDHFSDRRIEEKEDKKNFLKGEELSLIDTISTSSKVRSPLKPPSENTSVESPVLTSSEKQYNRETFNQSPTKIGLKFKIMKERLNLSLDNPNSIRRFESIDSNSSFLTDTSMSELDLTFEQNSPDNVFEKYYTVFRDGEINKELVLLSQNHQDGVYVIPSTSSLQVWFGVIFIRDGPYKDGIFHFTIYFKDDYPETLPVIRFRTKIFHPQIEPRKGTFNSKLNNSNLKEGKRLRVWQLLKHLRSCFYHLDINDAVNMNASNMFQTNYEAFKSNSRISVKNSIYAYEEQHYEGDNIIRNPLRGCLAQNNLIKGFKRYLSLNSNQNGTGAASIVGWAKNRLGNVLNNLNTYSFSEERTESFSESILNDSTLPS